MNDDESNPMMEEETIEVSSKAFLFLMKICLPLGNISRVNISHSTDTLPGPVKMRLADIDNDNKAKSYPCTNPFGNIMIVAPIISIIKRIAVILVRIPLSIVMPPLLYARVYIDDISN